MVSGHAYLNVAPPTAKPQVLASSLVMFPLTSGWAILSWCKSRLLCRSWRLCFLNLLTAVGAGSSPIRACGSFLKPSDPVICLNLREILWAQENVVQVQTRIAVFFQYSRLPCHSVALRRTLIIAQVDGVCPSYLLWEIRTAHLALLKGYFYEDLACHIPVAQLSAILHHWDRAIGAQQHASLQYLSGLGV